MASIYVRGKMLWARLKSETGTWIRESTELPVGEERAAKRYALKRQEMLDAKRRPGAEPIVDTVLAYAKRWTAERKKRGVGCADDDLSRLEKYALPALGGKRVADVKPRDIRDVVRALREAGELAPRTIIDIYNSLFSLFESSIVDELIEANPVKVKPGELPKKVDKDPTWRSQATYTTGEIERLISDVLIPVERRVQYALKAIAGMRHGEVAALRWRFVDGAAEPLGRINVVESWCSKTHKVKSTKTEETRAVPIHPTLAAILAAWKLSHWERIYGRPPTADDHVVPTRTMRPVDSSDANHAFKADLGALGLRVEAGEHRDRGGHDLRSWYLTQTVEDGADSTLIRRTTHSSDKSVSGGYQRFSWATICRELAKLRVSILDGKVLELGTAFSTKELKAGNRWRKVVTPSRLELEFSA